MNRVPESMKAELQSWNNGVGIDLETWVANEGRFALMAGYAALFCPEFIEFEDYIFEGGEISDAEIENIRRFESNGESTPGSIERTLNHFHIAHLHHLGCDDISADKLIFIGEALAKIYESRLKYLFPNKPCKVEFWVPDDPNDFDEYDLCFWQEKHE